MKKRLVFVCGELPFPPNNGMRIPTFNMIKFLQEKYQIGIIAFTDRGSPNIEGDIAHLKKFASLGCKIISSANRNACRWKKLFSFCFSRMPSFACGGIDGNIFSEIRFMLKEFSADIVIFDAERLAIYYGAVPPGVRKFLSPNDSISLALYNEIKYDLHPCLLKRLFVLINYRRSIAFEAKYYSQFDLCHFVSEVDASYIKNIDVKINTAVVSNGVDVSYFSSNKPISRQKFIFLFVGNLVGGNLIYMQRFLELVWVPLKKQFPQVTMTLVSRTNPKCLSKYIDLGVRIIDQVNDLRVVYEDATIVLSPVLKNCGILNKVLEGMSMSRVVVGYSVGFSGIPNAKHGVHYLSSETPAGLLLLLVEMVRGNFDLERIASNARSLMLSDYTWEKKVRQFSQVLEEL